jgi:hypothetical protein
LWRRGGAIVGGCSGVPFVLPASGRATGSGTRAEKCHRVTVQGLRTYWRPVSTAASGTRTCWSAAD